MYSYAEISQLKFNVHTISIDNNTETTNCSEALLALPPNTPNKKSKKGDHNSSISTSGPAIDTPVNSNPTTNSPTTGETPQQGFLYPMPFHCNMRLNFVWISLTSGI
ncbi:hypothetical protein RHGRI_017807 [Rhododendron griersonianum]|uniref:Uncharacterized protein n=1 Tax=Rhododendron griersonianum TaxID=479676 RepID=A0AAV6JZ73_9ERIC|nr:hypothetical protein RHGRI_017807 [Rhododendron griersonianum]